MTKRLFVAIDLDDAFRGALSGLPRPAGLIRARWVAPENLHVTVRFIGRVETSGIDRLVANLKSELSGFKPFSLRWNGVSYAPPGRPSRMLWADFGNSPEFSNLLESVERAVAGLAEPKTEKETLPHATLARFEPVSRPATEAAPQPVNVPDELRAAGCRLMESELLTGGPKYSVVAEFPFI